MKIKKDGQPLYVRVTKPFRKNLEALAEEKGMDVSEYIRYLIQREIDKSQANA